MTLTRSLRRLQLVVLALGLTLTATAVTAGELVVNQPLYGPTEEGFRQFLQDELANLVVGQSFEYQGHQLTAVAVPRLRRMHVEIPKRPHRDYGSARRGWALATVHVEVDGVVRAVEFEINAVHVFQPATWAWDRVQLELHAGTFYDFASRTFK
ncbi:MAG: hypothetical protein AAF533_28000 [Acidobacteriota bacterium]